MLALPSSLYPASYGCWPYLEDKNMSQAPFLNSNSGETEALDSPSSLQLQPQLDSFPSSAVTNDPSLIKKLNHNASERDRRKKLNTLYASLRAVLPGADQTRKLSIPVTISRVLKYIPDLQNQVEKLKQRKQEILSSIYKREDQTHVGKNKQSNGILRKSLPTVSVSRIEDTEVMIQTCACKNMRCSLSEILLNLEEEGLRVVDVSTSTPSEEVVFYNLHLQIRENQQGLNCELLSQKLLSMCEIREDLF